ncbi:type II toxin-antitoxin system HicB family antitoxin [Longirhabdus pacifica]|uniref:type II toxin-antitoxin system HicB family antitoxin n=1 Tax=Longirhabdus pacifica TaxID=2305227 RepID=UPI001009126C|nr:type II toxin-antitoxin system HicB family antitoxin [Longirhabdus pacifica]
MDRYIFPAVFMVDEEVGGYTVTFPDLPGCITEGDTLSEALNMAKEALELHLYCLEDEKESIPRPSLPENIEIDHGEFINLVEAYMPLIRMEMANKTIKKTLTIPKWLDDLGKDNKVNFSLVLQEGLRNYLGIKENSRNHETLKNK